MAMVLLFGLATVVIAVTASDDHRTFSAAWFLLGFVGTWREYARYRGARRRSAVTTSRFSG